MCACSTNPKAYMWHLSEIECRTRGVWSLERCIFLREFSLGEREKGIGTDEVFGGARVQNGAGKGLTIDDDEQARNNRGGLGCLALAE